ncbi:conserved hypothetical protein [Tolumonas auensis DSM 9187]|uniref:Uncharacterized protein n=1 Tax=Tolumonas auensis (strain DSM 9187 / NBRC 110442 / TA 4) TaxID=595494 RepID=C4LBC5_TOLAT|nr:hypothetical protein [Tolumonas auensis]ACQ92360.1 conserved hypothetical protein [Tolumonas auensis DSM 9187]
MPTPAEYAIHFNVPELKNQYYLDCFISGRKARFVAESADAIPLYSHDKTRQSLFTKGWNSVTEIDLLRRRQKQKEQEHGH